MGTELPIRGAGDLYQSCGFALTSRFAARAPGRASDGLDPERQPSGLGPGEAPPTALSAPLTHPRR